nr:MAG TPA: hypothetical protein [Bacteriophage sp.]
MTYNNIFLSIHDCIFILRCSDITFKLFQQLER